MDTNNKKIFDVISSDVKEQISNRDSEKSYEQESRLEEDLEQNSGKIYAECVRKLQNENAELELNIELKKQYSNNIFAFMCVWTIFVFIIIFLDAFTYTPEKTSLLYEKDISFDISDNVLVTLIGGTTISVIGLVGFVIQGLFPTNKITDKKI